MSATDLRDAEQLHLLASFVIGTGCVLLFVSSPRSSTIAIEQLALAGSPR